MSGLRLAFAGSPTAAVPSLMALVGSRHEVVSVVTREDSPQGRKRVLSPTAVGAVAQALGLPTIKTNRLSADVVGADVFGADVLGADVAGAISSIQPDLGVIVAYGGLVREPLLSTPRLGWINLHFSLLPRWRGAAPVQRAIMAGDAVTGASVFQLVGELDAGDVYGQFTQSIGSQETAGELLDSLAEGGAELLLRVVDAIADGTARADPQRGDVTLAPKLGLEDGRIDFTGHASTVTNRIRGATPEPGAFTMLDGARLKVLEATIARDAPSIPAGRLAFVNGRVLAGTAADPVELITVHPAGKKPMRAADWWRGRSEGASVIAE